MAQIIEHPRAHSAPIIQNQHRGRLPKAITSLNIVRRDLWYAAYEKRCLQEEIAKKLQAASEWERVGLAIRLEAEALKQKARMAAS